MRPSGKLHVRYPCLLLLVTSLAGCASPTLSFRVLDATGGRGVPAVQVDRVRDTRSGPLLGGSVGTERIGETDETGVIRDVHFRYGDLIAFSTGDLLRGPFQTVRLEIGQVSILKQV